MEKLVEEIFNACKEANNFSKDYIAAIINNAVQYTNFNYYDVFSAVMSRIAEEQIMNPDSVDITFEEPEDKIKDRCDIISEEGEKIDPTLFKKYIAYYDIYVYANEGQILKLVDATCLFLAKNIDTAKCISFYQITQTCLLEGLAVRSMIFKDIKEVE